MTKKKNRESKARQPENNQEKPSMKTRMEMKDIYSISGRVKNNPWTTGAAAVLGLLLVLDFFVHKHEPITMGNLPEFYAIFGFLCAIVLVFAAKALLVLTGLGQNEK